MKPYILLLLLASSVYVNAQGINVIAYFSGKSAQVEQIPAQKLSHIIFSFCHLKGNRLAVDSKEDSATIVSLVKLKKQNPKLKIQFSLGGWSGCETCSKVFSTEAARTEFSKSVKALCDYFHADGIDLDWEYPTIEGFPSHLYQKEDRNNFTQLIQSLRKEMGNNLEISFAAGGFKKFLEESVDWNAIMPLVDRVNLMTYDLVNGYATVTGHHTPLYSSDQTTESTDFAVQYLINHGVQKNKLIIGAAFYARVWENVISTNNGLYQQGKFKMGVDFKNFEKEFSKENGFNYFWDDKTQSPYYYSESKKLFATFDDKKSIALKTKYAIDQGLQGIMFWELTLDKPQNGLLDEIDLTVRKAHR